jgi:hypothetical protein
LCIAAGFVIVKNQSRINRKYLKQKSLRTQVNYSKIGIDKNQLSVNSRENSRTFPKIRGTALVTLNKVGGNPVSYNIYLGGFYIYLMWLGSRQ